MPPKHNTNAMEPPTQDEAAECSREMRRAAKLLTETAAVLDQRSAETRAINRRVYTNMARSAIADINRAIAALHSQPTKE